jgi:lipopolysaccharide export system protein LptA
MCTLKLLSSAVLLLVCPIGIAAAAPQVAPKPAASEESRTTITSKKMTVRNQENRAVFEGTVVLTKGSLVVHSDVMVVFFKAVDQAAKPNGQPKAEQEPKSDLPVMSNRAVSMIEATGKVVKIVKADGQATCRKAVYDEADDKIVLTGDPVAWQNGTRVSGEKITMYLAEDRGVVEGGSHVLIDQEKGGR